MQDPTLVLEAVCTEDKKVCQKACVAALGSADSWVADHNAHNSCHEPCWKGSSTRVNAPAICIRNE